MPNNTAISISNYSGGASTTTVWVNWISTGCAGGNTTTPVWNYWSNNTYSSGISGSYVQPPIQQLTPEQIEQHRLECERLQEQAIQAQREREEADKRAAILLEEHLDDEQKKTWRKAKVIELDSQRGKRYRIKQGIAGNVFELNKEGKEVTRLCCHPDNVPVDDVILTQLLALKFCEDHFVNTANKTRLAA